MSRDKRRRVYDLREHEWELSFTRLQRGNTEPRCHLILNMTGRRVCRSVPNLGGRDSSRTRINKAWRSERNERRASVDRKCTLALQEVKSRFGLADVCISVGTHSQAGVKFHCGITKVEVLKAILSAQWYKLSVGRLHPGQPARSKQAEPRGNAIGTPRACTGSNLKPTGTKASSPHSATQTDLFEGAVCHRPHDRSSNDSDRTPRRKSAGGAALRRSGRGLALRGLHTVRNLHRARRTGY